MSLEAMLWAMVLAPVPCDEITRRGVVHRVPSSSCAFVLVGLGNHADPDGRNAFPSTDALATYTRLSDRSVQTAIDRLAADEIITPSDPAVIAAKIKHPGHRPQGWDLAVHRIREDLTRKQLDRIAVKTPMLAGFIAHARAAEQVPEPDPPHEDGVKPLHPTSPGDEPPGVKPLHGRGEAASPKPSLEPSTPPPPAPPVIDRAPVDLVVVLLDELPESLRLSVNRGTVAAEVERLAVAGWDADALRRALRSRSWLGCRAGAIRRARCATGKPRRACAVAARRRCGPGSISGRSVHP